MKQRPWWRRPTFSQPTNPGFWLGLACGVLTGVLIGHVLLRRQGLAGWEGAPKVPSDWHRAISVN